VKSNRPKKGARKPPRRPALGKVLTGIAGLDEITEGGLPKGRPTLLCGGAGCGKTLLAMEFLVHGALEYGEPGVFMGFEETAAELTTNFASFGYDLKALVAQKKLAIDHVHIERSEIEETGEYDLEGLFIRLGSAIDSIGAKRVVLDTFETLFAGLSRDVILRSELRRLFRWLKKKGVTAIVTCEEGEKSLSSYGLEEYVADCVILLDHRSEGQVTTRRLRIGKYRGSTHDTCACPFVIAEDGISIMPITSMGMKHAASTERVSSGILGLDGMMSGKGYYRGSSVLVSGTAGSGKTSVAAYFAQAATGRGERCLWFAYEESCKQIIRNMRSIGVDLAPAVQRGTLLFQAERPTVCGLERHLVIIHKLVEQFKPHVIVIDPITNFTALGNVPEIQAMLARLADFLKMRQITTLFTNLTAGGSFEESTDVGVSSLMDTWLLLRDLEKGAERNRVMHLLKSRGMAHSNQVREFVLTDHGVELKDVYVGPSGELLIGSARTAMEAMETAQSLALEQELESKDRELERKRHSMEAQVALLRTSFEAEQAKAGKAIQQGHMRSGVLADGRIQMARLRQPDSDAKGKRPKRKSGDPS